MGKALTIVVLALVVVPTALADTHDVLRVYVDTPGGVDAEFAWSSSSGVHPLAPTLRVFAAQRRPSDSLPSELLQTAHAFTGITPQTKRSRLLLAVGEQRIYAYPTREGDVCFYLVPFQGGQCAPAMDDGALPQVRRGLVWGLVDNEATRVDVRLRSRVLAAKRGRNAFYLRLPHGIRAPRQIVVHERDGIRHVYTIKRCRLRNVSPLTGAGPLAPPPC